MDIFYMNYINVLKKTHNNCLLNKTEVKNVKFRRLREFRKLTKFKLRTLNL